MTASRREWDAGEYHRVSHPQFTWGLSVLARASFRGDENVLDAGCGSGRLTRELLSRLPTGRVAAVDLSKAMIRQCRDILADAAERASCVCADLLALPFGTAFDVVFSAAAFHWVLDHERLFAELARVLKPGGRLEAQCGGGTNLQRAKDLVTRVAHTTEFVQYFQATSAPWYYADVSDTTRRLAVAGFTNVECWLEDAPVTFAGAEAFRDFVRPVVLRPWLASLPSAALKQRFTDAVTEAASRASPPFTLDYQRLNLRAVRA